MEFLDGMKVVEVRRPLKRIAERTLDALGHISFLGTNTLASRGDHLPRGAEAMLAEEQDQMRLFEPEFNTSGR